MEKEIVLTGMRPTGKLHIGHYVGVMPRFLKIQEDNTKQLYLFIADMQALTDNAKNPVKVSNSVLEVAIDYLSCGIDPTKTTLFIQSQIPELTEITMYYANLVTVSRLQRNPTIKEEIKLRNFQNSIPAGFLMYPVSQAADITAFNAKYIPVGEDQAPLIEQAREIVEDFNRIYGDTLVMPSMILPENEAAKRLPGTDGHNKMSKSLNNCIYLSDDSETVRKKVMSMYTDPNHIRVEDPGDTKNNPVFIYLDALCKDRAKFQEMKEHYERGGLGDVACKKYLYQVLEELLEPIRQKRKYYEEHLDEVKEIYRKGSLAARENAKATLKRIRQAIGIIEL